MPDSTELFGLHLGMTLAQVKTRIPQIEFGPVDEFGVSKTTFNPSFHPAADHAAFAGVRSISLDFLDERLISLWLGYESSFKWQTVPDFVTGISQSLHLPNAWQQWKVRGNRIRCADFQATVSLLAGGASFHLTDETAQQTIAARREAREQEAEDAAENGRGIMADKQRKVYYSNSCVPPSDLKEKEVIFFKTSEEAEQSGYKQATNCRKP